MNQHPKVTLEWALRGLEAAIGNLGEGVAERRVRRQFHQLLLAVDRDVVAVEIQRLRGVRANTRAAYPSDRRATSTMSIAPDVSEKFSPVR